MSPLNALSHQCGLPAAGGFKTALAGVATAKRLRQGLQGPLAGRSFSHQAGRAWGGGLALAPPHGRPTRRRPPPPAPPAQGGGCRRRGRRRPTLPAALRAPWWRPTSSPAWPASSSPTPMLRVSGRQGRRQLRPSAYNWGGRSRPLVARCPSSPSRRPSLCNTPLSPCSRLPPPPRPNRRQCRLRRTLRRFWTRPWWTCRETSSACARPPPRCALLLLSCARPQPHAPRAGRIQTCGRCSGASSAVPLSCVPSPVQSHRRPA